ncbi:hypothetical protein Bca101_075202 [Brassica carinata]
MSSGGRLSCKQKGKAVATASSPARDMDGTPLDEFELVHREAMINTRSLELSQRILVSESARLYREEAREAPTDAKVYARDGWGGARDGVPPVNFVPTCYCPGGIFEELPALAPKFLGSPEIGGQSWEKVA